jgi:hypothetical protein
MPPQLLGEQLLIPQPCEELQRNHGASDRRFVCACILANGLTSHKLTKLARNRVRPTGYGSLALSARNLAKFVSPLRSVARHLLVTRTGFLRFLGFPSPWKDPKQAAGSGVNDSALAAPLLVRAVDESRSHHPRITRHGRRDPLEANFPRPNPRLKAIPCRDFTCHALIH